jgi:hypothetical protein
VPPWGRYSTNRVSGNPGAIQFWIVVGLTALASFVDTLIQTGDVSAALTSAVASAAISVLTAPGNSLLGAGLTAIAGETVALAVQVAYQAYSAVEKAQDGGTLSAALGFSLAALGMAALAQRMKAEGGGAFRGSAQKGDPVPDLGPLKSDGSTTVKNASHHGLEVKVEMGGGTADVHDEWWPHIDEMLANPREGRTAMQEAIKQRDGVMKFKFGSSYRDFPRQFKGSIAATWNGITYIDPGYDDFAILPSAVIAHEMGHLYGGPNGGTSGSATNHTIAWQWEASQRAWIGIGRF